MKTTLKNLKELPNLVIIYKGIVKLLEQEKEFYKSKKDRQFIERRIKLYENKINSIQFRINNKKELRRVL